MEGSDCAGAWFDETHGSRASATAWNEDQIAALREFIAALPQTIASQAEFAPELLERLQKAGERLQESEPPPEWKEFLEPLVKLAEGEPTPDQLIQSVQAAIGKLDADELRKIFEKAATRPASD